MTDKAAKKQKFSFDDVENVEESQEAKESEKEERQDQSEEPDTKKFIAAVIALMLIDLVVFCFYETWAAPLSITIIQIILILVLADIWNQKSIAALLRSVVNNFSNSRNKD